MPKNNSKTSNKKLIIIAIATLVVLAVFGFVFYKVLGGASQEIKVEETLLLDAKYKNTDGQQIELAEVSEDPVATLDQMFEDKKSFVLYVSLPICNGDAAKFKQYVLDFQHREKVSFYYLTSDYIKDSLVYETVKYFPSVIIVKEGKIINYLKYDSDEDIEYYKSYDGFSKWFKSNVEY